MKTRHIILAVILLGGAFLFNACSNFLEMDVSKKIVDGKKYYTTENEMNMAITGVYDILGKGPLYAYGFVTRYATEADEGYYARVPYLNGCQFYNMNSADGDVLLLWTTLYQGIARANVILDNIDRPSMSDFRRAVIRGEALFLRAFYYFLLIQNFGDVPLVTTATMDSDNLEYDVPRSSIEEVYEFITKDMIEAEKQVPGIRDIGYGGRISKSAVRAILARVYLHWAGYPLKKEEKYEDVVYWTDLVITDTEAKHALNPSYRQVFINMAQDQYDINESIWEVEFSNKGNGGLENGQIGSWIGVTSTNNSVGMATGYIAALPELFSLYKNGDLRRDRAIANFYYSAPEANLKYYSSAIKYGKKVAKWRRSEETALPKVAQRTSINFPIIRFSDVLLMYAEAVNELSAAIDAPQEAIDKINLLRRRAWASGVKKIIVTAGGSGYTSRPTVRVSGACSIGARAVATIENNAVVSINLIRDMDLGLSMGEGYNALPKIIISGGGGSGAEAKAEIYKKEEGLISAMSKEEFRQFIRDERSRELCFEGLRKYDLMRWELLVEKLKLIEKSIEQNAEERIKFIGLSFANVEEKHYLLPIPITELNLNKELTQNPGY